MFNFTPPPGPISAIPPELLARLAQAGFRPPPATAAPGAIGGLRGDTATGFQDRQNDRDRASHVGSMIAQMAGA